MERGPVLEFLFTIGEIIWFPYGIWVLETIMTLVAFLFLYFALKKIFPKFISFLAVLFAIAACAAYNANGSNTESLSLAFSGIAMYVFVRAYTDKCVIPRRWLVICGALFTAVLLIRVNNAYLWVAGVPLLIAVPIKKRQYSAAAKYALYLFAGCLSVTVPVLIWLWANGAIGDWYTDTIGYAAGYVNDIGFIEKMRNGISLLNSTQFKYLWFVVFMVAGYHIYQICKPTLENSNPGYKTVKGFFHLAGILGFTCASMSGYPFPHYMLMLLPVFALLGAYFLELLYTLCGKREVISCMLAIALLFIGCSDIYLGKARGIGAVFTAFPDTTIPYVQVANYIQSNTEPKDKFTVFANNGRGAILQNLIDGRIVDTFLALTFTEPLRSQQTREFVYVLERNHKYFVNTEGNSAMPESIQTYVDQNYSLVLNTQSILLYEYSGETPAT
jgi:hypothetical protein